MSDTVVLEVPTTEDVTPEQEASTKKQEPLFVFKAPGVWGKLFPKTSKEGKPACFGMFKRYKKVEGGYEDQVFINSLDDIDNAIDVLLNLKREMRNFYKKRDA